MTGCPVCSSMEPKTVNRLLLLGRGPRWIASAGLGVDRRAVAKHRDKCLIGDLRDGTRRDLYAMVQGGGS